MTIPPPIPITIITGFLGSGKTTCLLNLIPQLPSTYRLALLKNEFGDLAVDSQLANEQSISGVHELLNGCICCNLVGQLGDALIQLRDQVRPDRIIIETSGSAFPATLAMEVNRLSSISTEANTENTRGSFVLDGVISVIDVENWQGYEDTSYTAKMQAKYTDLIIFNKWELVDEHRFDLCLDRLGDLELDTPTPWVKSDRGRVDKDVLLGIDGALLAKSGISDDKHHDNDHEHDHEHSHDHQSEVEVLSLTLQTTTPESTTTTTTSPSIDFDKFDTLLKSSPKDQIYRIKGIIRCSQAQKPTNSDPTFLSSSSSDNNKTTSYILNWAFGRWTFTPTTTPTTTSSVVETETNEIARLTFILARYESAKWKRKLESGDFIAVAGGGGSNTGEIKVERLV